MSKTNLKTSTGIQKKVQLKRAFVKVDILICKSDKRFAFETNQLESRRGN